MSRTALHRSSVLFCSFCGKAENEVIHIVAGPSVFICNECIEVCVADMHSVSVKDIRSDEEEAHAAEQRTQAFAAGFAAGREAAAKVVDESNPSSRIKREAMSSYGRKSTEIHNWLARDIRAIPTPAYDKGGEG